MAGTPDDIEIIRSLKQGDVFAYDSLFRKFNKKVYYFALSYLKDSEFPSGTLVTYTTLETSSHGFLPYGMLEFRGTKGTLWAGGGGDFKLSPCRPGQFQTWEKLTDAEEYKIADPVNGRLADGSWADPTGNLIRNFLDCIKSRNTTMCTLEDGHLATNMAHLATISMQVNQRLNWDAEKEIISNSDDANRLLHYEYRKPWKL
jgi:hypothetical protein